MSEQSILFDWVLVGFAVIIALGVVGWLTRRRRQRDIAAPQKPPTGDVALLAEVEGLYVSTTVDGQPLNRIAVHGLGFRARGTFAVTDAGVVLALPGNNVFIPRDDIREVTRAQYTIDRVVEEGGLVLLAWTLGTTKVDTYLRVEETQELVDAIARLITPAPSKESSTSGA